MGSGKAFNSTIRCCFWDVRLSAKFRIAQKSESGLSNLVQDFRLNRDIATDLPESGRSTVRETLLDRGICRDMCGNIEMRSELQAVAERSA